MSYAYYMLKFLIFDIIGNFMKMFNTKVKIHSCIMSNDLISNVKKL